MVFTPLSHIGMFVISDNLERAGNRRLMRPSASFQPFTYYSFYTTLITTVYILTQYCLSLSAHIIIPFAWSPSNGLYILYYKVWNVSFLKTLRSCICGFDSLLSNLCHTELTPYLSLKTLHRFSMDTLITTSFRRWGSNPRRLMSSQLRWAPFDLPSTNDVSALYGSLRNYDLDVSL